MLRGDEYCVSLVCPEEGRGLLPMTHYIIVQNSRRFSYQAAFNGRISCLLQLK
jgi:hypothetical protein